MLQVWFLSWQTEVNPRKPMPATPSSLVKQNIPDSSAPARERRLPSQHLTVTVPKKTPAYPAGVFLKRPTANAL
jgi:hypothetical protein